MKQYEMAAWRESMRLKINYNNMMQSALIPDGFTAEELRALPLKDAFQAMYAKRPQLKWMELPHNQQELVEKIEETAAWVREEADAFVVLGIDAFDQPGVEEGKKATYALLGKPGFDEKRAELNARPAEDPAYIL